MYDNSPAMDMPMVDKSPDDFRHAPVEDLAMMFINITDEIEKLMATREQIKKVFNEKHNRAYSQVIERDQHFMSRTGIGYQDQPTEMAVDPRRF